MKVKINDLSHCIWKYWTNENKIKNRTIFNGGSIHLNQWLLLFGCCTRSVLFSRYHRMFEWVCSSFILSSLLYLVCASFVYFFLWKQENDFVFSLDLKKLIHVCFFFVFFFACNFRWFLFFVRFKLFCRWRNDTGQSFS